MNKCPVCDADLLRPCSTYHVRVDVQPLRWDTEQESWVSSSKDEGALSDWMPRVLPTSSVMCSRCHTAVAVDDRSGEPNA